MYTYVYICIQEPADIEAEHYTFRLDPLLPNGNIQTAHISLSLYIYIYVCMYVCVYGCMYLYIYIYRERERERERDR